MKEGRTHKRFQKFGMVIDLDKCTGCGSCTSLCQGLLRAVAPGYEDERKRVLCACVPFGEDQLREILRGQRLKSVQEVLEIYGNGVGCEVCKPALSYLVDVVWCGDHDEDRSARLVRRVGLSRPRRPGLRNSA